VFWLTQFYNFGFSFQYFSIISYIELTLNSLSFSQHLIKHKAAAANCRTDLFSLKLVRINSDFGGFTDYLKNQLSLMNRMA
jgi:hypothetical protein